VYQCNLSLIFSVFKSFEHFFICRFFRSGADFGRYMGSLLGSLLKYNAPEDFLEVLFLWGPGSLLAESSLISKCKSIFKYIKSFKLVVHGGWCIDGNDNIVNT
ncbi:unnamed protein product, partial [Brassica rapa]